MQQKAVQSVMVIMLSAHRVTIFSSSSSATLPALATNGIPPQLSRSNRSYALCEGPCLIDRRIHFIAAGGITRFPRLLTTTL